MRKQRELNENTNEIKFGGVLEEYSINKTKKGEVLKFTLVNGTGLKKYRCEFTCFDKTLFDKITTSINKKVVCKGTFTTNIYKNKKGDWVNSYNIYLDKFIELEGDN